MASIVIAGDTSGSVTLQAPSAAGSGTVITLPTISDTIVTRNSTDTLTNKTLTSPVIATPSISGSVVLSGNTTLSGASNSIANAAITASTISLSAGSTSTAALAMTSGSLLSGNTAGAVEYDGNSFYAIPFTSARGVVPAMSTFCLTSGYAGNDATGDQAAFGQSSYTFWNPASTSVTYMFEVNIGLTKTAGTTSHTISFGFGNGATVSSVFYRGTINSGTTSTFAGLLASPQQFAATTGALTVASSAIASAAANWSISIVGAVRFSGLGTWGPRYSLSAAPGGAYTTVAGSYMRVWSIGNQGNTGGGNVSVRVGNWS
jgi:hypothetical protein